MFTKFQSFLGRIYASSRGYKVVDLSAQIAFSKTKELCVMLPLKGIRHYSRLFENSGINAITEQYSLLESGSKITFFSDNPEAERPSLQPPPTLERSHLQKFYELAWNHQASLLSLLLASKSIDSLEKDYRNHIDWEKVKTDFSYLLDGKSLKVINWEKHLDILRVRKSSTKTDEKPLNLASEIVGNPEFIFEQIKQGINKSIEPIHAVCLQYFFCHESKPEPAFYINDANKVSFAP